MFLGSSEGVGAFTELFTDLDPKFKIYQRKESVHVHERQGFSHNPQTSHAKSSAAMASAANPLPMQKLTLRQLTEQTLLEHCAPTSALVNEQGDILYLHGRTGMYLEPAPGETGVSNILKMSRKGLRRELSMTLRRAVDTHTLITCPGVRVKTNGHFTSVNLRVLPVPLLSSPLTSAASHTDHYLVTFEVAAASSLGADLLYPSTEASEPHGEDAKNNGDENAEMARHISTLQTELRAKDDYLQSTLEELETSNEELKSSNEEMQSINEELQSTNEELETSKEEMQSVNEELGTINAELQTKLTDLSRANNDMNNLLAGTGIGTVFVDQKLRLLRFTPAAQDLINFIPGDVGRPVHHIVSNLVGYDRLATDIQAVLDTLVAIETNVKTKDNKWYGMRILPYRNLENVVEGAVISFVEITETVSTREALRKTNELLRLAVVVRDSHDAITVQDLQGNMLAWNPGAVRLYGWTEDEALSMNVQDRTPLEARADAGRKSKSVNRSEVLEPYVAKRINKSGKVLEVSITSTALLNAAGHIDAIATTERLLDPAPSEAIA